MFAIKKYNKGTSLSYVSMISKILKFFNIGLPNLSYKSHGSSQVFSQRALTNLGYFWDVQHMAYYFLASKSPRRIYNFDDSDAFEDECEEKGVHMEDDKHIGGHRNLHEEDTLMHDALVDYNRGASSGANFC